MPSTRLKFSALIQVQPKFHCVTLNISNLKSNVPKHDFFPIFAKSCILTDFLENKEIVPADTLCPKQNIKIKIIIIKTCPASVCPLGHRKRHKKNSALLPPGVSRCVGSWSPVQLSKTAMQVFYSIIGPAPLTSSCLLWGASPPQPSASKAR